jgi:peptidyl-tRNA hydrolase ICT1
MSALEKHVPKLLVSELQSCRYYVKSSDSIQIQCDAHRNRKQNRDETLIRLNDEIKKIYDKRVPGVTSAEQQAKVDKL